MDRARIVSKLKELENLLRHKISDERRHEAERLVIELNRRLFKLDYVGVFDKKREKE